MIDYSVKRGTQKIPDKRQAVLMQTTDDAAAVEIGKVILLRMLNPLALGKNRQGNAAQTAPTSK